jgi:hypothetical protein
VVVQDGLEESTPATLRIDPAESTRVTSRIVRPRGRAVAARENFVRAVPAVVHRRAISITSSTLAAVAARGRAWGPQLPEARSLAARQHNSCTNIRAGLPAVVRVPAVDRALATSPATFREIDQGLAAAVNNSVLVTTFDRGRAAKANGFDRATTLARAGPGKAVVVSRFDLGIGLVVPVRAVAASRFDRGIAHRGRAKAGVVSNGDLATTDRTVRGRVAVAKGGQEIVPIEFRIGTSGATGETTITTMSGTIGTTIGTTTGTTAITGLTTIGGITTTGTIRTIPISITGARQPGLH